MHKMWWHFVECVISSSDCPMTADQGNKECLHGKQEDSSLKFNLLDFQVKDVWFQILKYTNVFFSITDIQNMS